MSQATNFTIKDGASTPADTLFTNVQPSGGGIPAVYLARTKGTSPANQPKIQVSAKGGQKKREAFMTFLVPFAVVGADSIARVVDNAYAEVRVVLPDSVPNSVRSDLRAYLANSLDIAQFQETVETGYSPN